MSDAVPPPAAPIPPPSSSQSRWGAGIVSLYSLTLLLAALVFAYIMKNENLLVLLAGVIATNATSVVNYYVGSSASSQAKDFIISGQLPQPPPAVQPLMTAHHQ